MRETKKLSRFGGVKLLGGVRTVDGVSACIKEYVARHVLPKTRDINLAALAAKLKKGV